MKPFEVSDLNFGPTGPSILGDGGGVGSSMIPHTPLQFLLSCNLTVMKLLATLKQNFKGSLLFLYLPIRILE